MAETKNMTIRLPREVYEELRLEAFEKRSPIAQVILDAIKRRHGEPAAQRQPCDIEWCSNPSTVTTTPGGFRFCDSHRSVTHPLEKFVSARTISGCRACGR